MVTIKVLFTIAGLHPESGGPSRSVPILCELLAQHGVEVEIVSHHYGPALTPPLTPKSPVQITFVNCSSLPCRRLQWTPRFKMVLHERCAHVQLVHDTGLWLSTNHAAALVSRRARLPRIVSPRGMLTAWALQHKGWKKRLAWYLYQSRDLRTATVLHATSHEEVSTFRAAGLTQPVAMIPNGVELPPAPHSTPRAPHSALRTALFLGRIHPIKGLLNLVHAWAQVRPAGWRLLIVGRDELDHANELRRAISESSLDQEVTLKPAVNGAEKWRVYSESDLFVLPSHSENFGIVVAEALACSLPVITTRGTPWQDLEKHCCGWWVDVGVEPLALALKQAVQLDDEQRRQMGQRGRELVGSKYTWEAAARQMASVYLWITRHGERPACVTDGA